jgi:uncharacterized alpha-E superfamily protein
MLRRVADHLFWMARYLERAQWRARLADVNYHLLVGKRAQPAPSPAFRTVAGDQHALSGGPAMAARRV